MSFSGFCLRASQTSYVENFSDPAAEILVNDKEEILVDDEEDTSIIRVLNQLNQLGFDSLASLLDTLIESNSLSYAEFHRMLLALFKYETHCDQLLTDKEIGHEMASFAFQIASSGMETLVAHKALRLPISNVSPDTLEQFDPKVIAEHQSILAPLTTSVLRACTGLDASDIMATANANLPKATNLELRDDPTRPAPPRGRDCKQIATISLCLLCYARNKRSNVLQMTMDYFAYADNTTKQMVEIFHRMGLAMTYKTVKRAFINNAIAVLEKLKEKAWCRRFFVSYNNMNIYSTQQDQHLHNKAHQIDYTAGYVSFMHSPHDEDPEATWYKQYLDANQMDYDAANQLVADDFLPSPNDLQHRALSVRYMISKVLANYFPTSLYKQKVRHADDRLLPQYMKWPAPLLDIQC